MVRIIILQVLFLSIFVPLAYSSSGGCPEKIVSVTLASDEILLDVVEDRDRIAAVTYLADDESISNVVEKSKNIKKIHANIEQIVEINPDLVITAGYLGADFIKLLRSAGLETVVLEDVKDIESIKNNILNIGKIVCEKDNASDIVSKMESDIENIQEKYNTGKNRPEVLFYSAPGFTAGPDSIINSLISMAGGKNAFQPDSYVTSSRISLEYIVTIDPDVIILSNFSPSDPDFEKRFINNPAILQSTAYKTGNIHTIEGKYIVSASHYVVEALEKLAEIIHKDR